MHRVEWVHDIEDIVGVVVCVDPKSECRVGSECKYVRWSWRTTGGAAALCNEPSGTPMRNGEIEFTGFYWRYV